MIWFSCHLDPERRPVCMCEHGRTSMFPSDISIFSVPALVPWIAHRSFQLLVPGSFVVQLPMSIEWFSWVVFLCSSGEKYEPSFYKLSDGNSSVCLATGFSQFGQLGNNSWFSHTEAVRISQDSLFNQLAFINDSASADCPEGAFITLQLQRHPLADCTTVLQLPPSPPVFLLRWFLALFPLIFCLSFRWRWRQLQRRSTARLVSALLLNVRLQIFRTISLCNVVVPRPHGEPGVSRSHGTSRPPPEDDGVQCSDDSSSVVQSVWVQHRWILRRVVSLLRVSSTENVLFHPVEPQRSFMLVLMWDAHGSFLLFLSHWCKYFSFECLNELQPVKIWWNKTTKHHPSTPVSVLHHTLSFHTIILNFWNNFYICV